MEMTMMNKTLTQGLAAGLIVLVAACGGGGDGAQSSVDSDAGVRAPDDSAAVDPAVASMAGLWDFSVSFEDGSQDRYYWHFIADGTARAYDYAGDSYDGGGDCHVVHEGSLQAVDAGLFVLAIEREAVYAQMAVDGGQLQFDDERLSKVATTEVAGLSRCAE